MPLPTDTTAVVVTWRGVQWIDACLDALREAHDGAVLVVDNASDDGTARRLAARPDVDVVRLPKNVGFAGGVAAALDRVTTPFVALVNDDARVEPDFLRELLAPFFGPDGESIAATTAKILLEDGTVNNAGSSLLPDGYAFDRGLGEPDDGRWDEPEDVDAFCGGAAVLRTAAVREVGGFPAEFFLYYEDTDVSVRLRRRGWRIRYVPSARVIHRHAASSDAASTRFHFYNERNRLLLLVRCFPADLARREVWRFTRSIGGFALRRLRGQRPSQASERPEVRVWVLTSLLRLLPGALRARRSISAWAAQPLAAS